MGPLYLASDVGGTFTDTVLLDPQDKTFSLGKTLTTPQNPSIGVSEGAQGVLRRYGGAISDLVQINHCTTLAGNLIVERKGAKVGLIATEGFRDSLELGREIRYDIFDLFLTRAEPLVRRYLRRTVSERMDWAGNVIRPLELEEIDAIMEFFQSEGVESIAVALLHSYRDSTHEQNIRDHLKARYPKYYVSISSAVAPEVREYERTSTTVTNAYVQPAMDRYVTEMGARFKEMGFAGTFYPMGSGGGLTTVDVALEFPVRMVESGPAAGAVAAAYYGQMLGEKNLVSFDMGGTTAKICLTKDGQPSRTNELEVAREHRFKKGSGLILRVPAIEMVEIGAGGGSIAHIDSMALLKIGPESAGADPGPACYGRGGEEPTVTDADLALGYLDPGHFLGGEMALDAKAAEEAIQQRIARPLGMDLTRAVSGIHDVVNENMATAARVYASEQGVDVRPYAMIAFGGAGPVHAYRVAKLLGISKVICPLGAGVFSSLGLMVAPRSFDFVHSYISRVDSLDWDYLQSMYKGMEDHAEDILTGAGVDPGDISLALSADMRYVGQGFEINVSITREDIASRDYSRLVDLFNNTYEALFRRHISHVPVEAITWRCMASEPPPKHEVRFRLPEDSVYPNGLKGKRPVYVHEEGKYVEVPVYDRYSLPPGTTFSGPAIVEERESTVVVGPEARTSIDEYQNLIMEMSSS